MKEAYDNTNVSGSALYSAIWLMKNPVGINRAISEKFRTPALPPYLGQLPENKPERPAEAQSNGMKLSWDEVEGCYYAVYKETDGKTAQLVSIAESNNFTVKEDGKYFVTAVRKGNNAESIPSNIITVNNEKDFADSSLGSDSGNSKLLANSASKAHRWSRR